MEEIHKHHKSVRFCVIASFALLPFFLITVFLAFKINAIAEERATLEASRLVRVVENQQEQVFRNIRNTLISLVEFAEVDKEHLNTGSCNQTFASLLEHINRKEQMYNNLLLVNPQGDVVCSALNESGKVNLADRNYFQRVLQKRDFVIGDYIIGRLTGNPTLTVAYPILEENGEVKLVAVGALNLGWINESAKRINTLESGPILVVTERDGKIIAQHPDGLTWVGQVFYPETAKNKTEASFKTLWLNNLPYLFSYVRLPLDAQLGEDHLKFYLGIPNTQISNFIEKEIVNYFIILFAIVGVFSLAGWLVSKKITKDLLSHQ
jgi:C4-dicarboxylate-specific signal transduction histidine kinase